MLKKVIKYIVSFLHMLIVLFIFLGAFLPKKYLIYFIFAWPLMYLHWYTNDENCISTEIECWADKKPYCSEPADDFPFVTNLLKKFNITIHEKETKKYIIEFTLTTFWLIGVYRYYN